MPTRIHGYSIRVNGKQNKTYTCWVNMVHRCERRSHPEFHLYGGRGISVCEHWHDFSQFYADMGEKPDGLSLDRIDNDGSYSPSNCRWATPKEQTQNRRTIIVLDYDGQQKTIWEWADLLGIRRQTIYFRYWRGWSTERILTQPLQHKRKLSNLRSKRQLARRK